MFVLKNNFRRFLPIKIFHILVENILPPVVFYPSIIGYNMGKQLEVFDVIMSINTWVHTHTTHYTGATDCPCNVEFSLSLEVNCFKYLAQFSHQQVIWRENEQRSSLSVQLNYISKPTITAVLASAGQTSFTGHFRREDRNLWWSPISHWRERMEKFNVELLLMPTCLRPILVQIFFFIKWIKVVPFVPSYWQ